MKKHGELRAAFPITVPVLAGYLFLGIAFGVLMSSKGYGPLWSLGVSLFVYAGSMQFVAAGMLAAGFDPLGTVLMTLMVNARHFFYGISMLDKFHGTGKYKPYLIFALSDETFSILSATEVPAGCDKGRFYFFIALLNQLYWVVGSALGGVFGSLIPFDTTGIDFVLTALFVVLFIGQWNQTHNHRPMLMGVGCAAACLVVFGADQFMIPAMLCILVCAGVFQKSMGEGME